MLSFQHMINIKNINGIFYFYFFPFIFISWRLITLQYCSGFCHTLTWISHGFTCIPHPDPPSHVPLHPILLGLPSAPGLSTCLAISFQTLLCILHLDTTTHFRITVATSVNNTGLYSIEHHGNVLFMTSFDPYKSTKASCCCLVAKLCMTLCNSMDCVACHTPLSMGFPRQEYWSGLLCPPPGGLLTPGIEPIFPALTDGFFTAEPPGKQPIKASRADTIFHILPKVKLRTRKFL